MEEYPQRMSLGTLHSQAFKVLIPIPVVIDQYEHGFSAEWQATGEFGYGDTPSDARDDLIGSIKAAYEVYGRNSLGTALQEDWNIMQLHIEKVHVKGQ